MNKSDLNNIPLVPQQPTDFLRENDLLSTQPELKVDTPRQVSKKVFVETYGWPLDALSTDFS